MTSFADCLCTVPVCQECVEYNVGLYLNANETNREATLSKVARNAIVGDTIIGVSGFFLLNVVAARGTLAPSTKKITQILIVDCSASVERFWTFMSTLFQNRNLDRNMAINAIVTEISNNKMAYWPLRAQDRLQLETDNLLCEVQSGISFLSDDDKFKTIHTIALARGLVFKRINLFDPDSFTAIAQALKTADHSVDLLYVSNVSEFVRSSEDASGFVTSVRKVTDTRTLVIAAQSSVRGVAQRLMRRANGKEIASETFSYRYIHPDPLAAALDKLLCSLFSLRLKSNSSGCLGIIN